MHRSGTSLITHLLSICGAHLGADEDMMPPSADNPRGYWEHLRFVDLNERILAQLGGSWDAPPASLENLTTDESLDALRAEARALLREFAGQSFWGWKDPRNSLTLPFWKELIPSLKVVVCLRNPFEVSLSLRQRRHTPNPLGLILWRIYNQAILDMTTPDERIVTHYDAYFTHPEAELHRVLNFLGITPDPRMLERCRAAISQQFRHYRHQNGDASTLIHERYTDLYERLCIEAKFFGDADRK